MSKCKWNNICGLNADADSEGFCILHSHNPDKDKKAFARKFQEHRKKRGDNFSYFVFPETIDFRWSKFTKEANFMGSKFTGEADFFGAKFTKRANFFYTEFTKEATFFCATFTDEADFVKTTFTERADFRGTTFTKRAAFMEATFTGAAVFERNTFIDDASFWRTNFTKAADFNGATFMRDANFDGTILKGGDAIFSKSHLLGRTLFLGGKDDSKGKRNLIFSNMKVKTYFNDVVITPSNVVIFRDADLGRCSFRGTRIDKVEFTNVKWAVIRGKLGYTRTGIYDEIILLDSIKNKKKSKKKDKKNMDWEHIERVYRDLKINHTASGDHERAGEFHYGEKEMRRRNPSTPLMHRFFLNVYRTLSGYGERYLRPLFWTLFILFGCTISYLVLGIGTADGLSLGFKDSFTVLLYSLQVMTLLRPTELQPIGVTSTAIKVFQSISGPIIIGLFALALKQRLKR